MKFCTETSVVLSILVFWVEVQWIKTYSQLVLDTMSV